MAKVGEQLLAPEAGWKRIDDTYEKIKYNGTGWVPRSASGFNAYNNTWHYSYNIGDNIDIYFKSDKIRIISLICYNNMKDASVKFTLDNKDIVYKSFYGETGNNQGSWIVYERLNLTNSIHHIHISMSKGSGEGRDVIVLDCIDIDEDGCLLTEEEYNQSNYIKQDNKYYGFSDDNYDTTTKMYKEITLDDIKNLKYNSLISNLTKEITIGDETFKPIDKFTNFQLISPYNNKPKTVIGSKSKSGLIVANGDIYAGKISNRINSFTLEYIVNNNSAIKMAVSFDNGSTWKTYKDGAFQELSITIPNKYYANMTDEEKTNYSNAKATILESGFNASDLSSIDFNIDNLDTIRFAYVLYQDSIDDDCKMSDLSWNFNAKGYLQKMKDSEVDTSFCNGIIKITPLIDCEMIITNYNY